MVAERMQDLLALQRQLEAWREGKHRPTLAELDELINSLRCMHLASNFAFCQELMEEKMEETIEDARTEIEAHIMNVMTKLGLESTARKELPEFIDDIKKLGAPHDQAGENLARPEE